MMTKDSKKVYPLRQSRITHGDNVIHDRSAPRHQWWFILDLALPSKNFIPAGSAGLVTADGLTFGDTSRREQQ